ncbi:MAG TPA: hypothetical protein VIN38_05855 [Thiobacillus sp.]
MPTSQPASLLVAALVMLRRPCARNQATAQLLLLRAAEYPGLTASEREACLSLADELEMERPEVTLSKTRGHAPFHPIRAAQHETTQTPNHLAISPVARCHAQTEVVTDA